MKWAIVWRLFKVRDALQSAASLEQEEEPTNENELNSPAGQITSLKDFEFAENNYL